MFLLTVCFLSFTPSLEAKEVIASITGSTAVLRDLCRQARNGQGAPIYYPSGALFVERSGEAGATWLHEDGKIITRDAGVKGAAWFHRNGRILTHSAGQVGATWYYSNGRVVSHTVGRKGATWYREDGQIDTFDGGVISEEDLLYPCAYLN